jgi:hypothetical protein
VKNRGRDRPVLGRVAALLSRVRGAGRLVPYRGKARRIRELELVRKSSLFDSEWYLRTYPDVAEAGLNALDHYMSVGWREGRDPGPDFATSSYLKANRDVAMAGVNPLLHFVEFGDEEGRGSSAHRSASKQFTPPSIDFGPAAPCVSFPMVDEPPIRWTRGYRLRLRPDHFSAGDHVVGYAPDDAVRAKLKSSFSLLEALSGYRTGTAPAELSDIPRSADRLLDAWYVNATQSRTRWDSADFPFVIRAYQHDPLRDGTLCLVGEGLTASPVDPVDLNLQNPFFPVLLVFAAPDGTVRGAKVLAFPSLCRGGAHYSELLHSAGRKPQEDEMDVVGTGELLASRLLRLWQRPVRPAIARIEVDVRGGDGRGPMFQPDFQLWLRKVFNVSVAPIATGRSSAAEFLAKAVAIPTDQELEGSATLRIGSDMAPSIAALVEPETRGHAGASEVVAPFLVGSVDARQPAIAIELGRQESPLLDAAADGARARWPRLVPSARGTLPERFPVAAIVSSAHADPSDATLLVAIADLPVSTDIRSAITWVIDARGWLEGGLAQAVHALSLQIGGDRDQLSFVGAPDPFARSIARERYGGRVNCFDDVVAAIGAAQTSLVGFVGPGVLLHDRRTAAVLAPLLNREPVATVSCAVVNVEQSGINWHATIGDAGSFVTSAGAKLGRSECELVTAFLWGTHYPVASPGPQLWLARKSSLTEWLERPSGQLPKGVHICSSEVSASHIGPRSTAQPPAYIPTAGDERATRAQVLFG